MILRPVFADSLPPFDEIEVGQIWISHTHRTVNLRCPCGCGELTVLSLHPSRWHVRFDGKTVSLTGERSGSVWAHSGCGSHYFIRKNEVIWANAIDPRRHGEYSDVERSRMVAQSSTTRSATTWVGRASGRVVAFVRTWVVRR